MLTIAYIWVSKSFYCEGRDPARDGVQRKQPLDLNSEVKDPHSAIVMLESSIQTERRRLSTFRHESVKASKVSAPKIHPSLFLDELEAAADIVKWEQEQLATEDPVLVLHEVSPEYYSEAKPVEIWETQKPKPSNTIQLHISIEDELAAAADIAMWEEEQKQQSAIANEIAAAGEIARWDDEQIANGAVQKSLHAFSDEIAAAAAMVDWEFDHQDGKTAAVLRLVTHV